MPPRLTLKPGQKGTKKLLALPGGKDEQVVRELVDITKNMSPENRQELLEYARYRYQQQEGKKGK